MLFRRLNWNIVGWFRTVSAISYLIIALGLGAMIYHGFQGGGGFQPSHMLRLGLSFTGGTQIDVTYKQPVTTTEVKAAVVSLNLADAEFTTLGTAGNAVSIETQTSFANDSTQLWSTLGKIGPLDRASSSITSVGPSLGAEYLRNALLALLIALSIQFLYIAFRFGWNYIFGLVTVIALVRDAAMMIGIYALAGKAADDAFLAAVLTVIGYSVMDTIVILDRIRENSKLMAGQPFQTIVNESIKQTMTRSFNTLATVVITLVALYALGGNSLKDFAFALLVGICSGGYHSIFYSAPLVVAFRKRQLETAARRKSSGITRGAGRPGSAGAIRATGSVRGGTSRDEIVAARRERREKEKQQRGQTAGPVKYRRKRDDIVRGGTLNQDIVSSNESTDEDIPETPIDSVLEHAVENAPVEYMEDNSMLGYPATDPNALIAHQLEREEEIDPLDAQNEGLHDEALAQGHEEVNLNLEGFELESDAETEKPTTTD